MSYSSYNHGFNYPYRRPAKMEYGLKRVPDYTEMAYKEAVGKLRYFLSGNYSPSIRSYGGSASIKNLDEPDADSDKKYNPYSTLGEYTKPRPRLTTKYATLYADSLNKYSAPVSTYVPPTTTAPADPPSAANPDVINFIQKQEEYIEQLERESQYCRDELNSLLGKVKEVISENEHLHEAQKNKLISRMFHTYNVTSDTDDVDDVGDSTGLDSDNKATPSKAKKSGKYRPTKLEGPNIVFESRIAELEAHLSQAKIDLKKVQEENNENKRKLASGIVDSTYLDGFKRQIDNLQRDKSSLESQIAKLRVSLEGREGVLDGRYKRNEGVEQQLREERNNLEAELRRMKDDLAKERNKVRELASEGSRRAIQERSAAEQRYTAHFDDLSHDLAAQYDNVSKLQLEIERQRRDENDLKREISMKNATIDELKMELKTKTSCLQTDLAQAHAEKSSLDEELASARLAIERHQRQTKHETNRLNSEIQSLRQRLDRADADLVHSRRENLRLSEQIASLEKELNMKNLSPMSPEKTNKEKEFSTMIDNIENKHARTVAELETMIHSQNSLMEKLTADCRLLTDKLDDANRRHKEELATLHHQVELLGQTMQASTPDAHYKAPSTHATSAYRTGEYPTNSRPDHPRTITTGHAQISRQPSNNSIGDQRVNSNSQSRALSRQPSKNSNKLNNTETISQKYDPTKDSNEKDDNTEDYKAIENMMVVEDSQYQQDYEQSQYVANDEQYALVGNTEYKNQGYEQGYTEGQQEYTEGQQVYTEGQQGYTEGQQEYTEGQKDYTEGQQGYTEGQQVYTEGQQAYTEGQQANTEGQQANTDRQQGYTEGQQGYTDGEQVYTEGQYEQYPQQQYADPNAQYEGQYSNYAADPNYQTDNYGNQQYVQQTREEISEPGNTESKRSNSPNEKVTNKS